MITKFLKPHPYLSIWLWILLYPCTTVFGQTNQESRDLLKAQIEKAMSKFMSEQKRTCVSFHTSIKISFDEIGKIKTIQTSDNLTTSEKEKLTIEIKNIEKSVFENYAREQQFYNIDMLIRMNMISYSDNCTNKDSEVGFWKLADVYDGVPLSGLYYHFGTLTLRVQLENDRTFTN